MDGMGGADQPEAVRREYRRRLLPVVGGGLAVVLLQFVVNSTALSDAAAPPEAPPGASDAAARSCDSPFPGRLESLTTTDRPLAFAMRCVYSIVGRPAFSSEIHCVDGEWVGSTGYNAYGELGVACVP